MVYNAMYPVGQRPFFITNRKVKKKEDEESSNSSATEREVEEQPQVLKHEGNDEFTKSVETSQSSKNSGISANASYAYSDVKATSAVTEKSYANVNPEVNIAQILKDYKNTALAIGTPPELEEEVNAYLDLVKVEVTKENPNTKIVKSNLKNAASLLDGYITETLNRPSKVVENWADALFLQKINYNYNEGDINEQFLVKFPDRKNSATATTTTETETPTVETQNSSNTDAANTESKLSVQIPDDSQLANLFIKAKKYSNNNDSENALSAFNQALARADEVNDTETKAKVYYEIGQIYDKNDNLPQALDNYSEAAKNATDANVKTKAYYSMGQIYDDFAYLNVAVDNYMASVSYAGEAENFKAQSTSLTKIGNILTDKYDDSAFDFYDEAKNMADVSQDSKVKGYVSSNTADAYVDFKQPKKALKSYFNAVRDYSEAESPQKVAQNYSKAADLMYEYGNPVKAQNLLIKARNSANEANDTEMIAQINAKLSQFI